MSLINSIQCAREYMCRRSSSFAARVSGTSERGVASGVAVEFMGSPFKVNVVNWLLHTAGHEVNVAVAGSASVGKPAQAIGAEPFFEGFGGVRWIAKLVARHSLVLELPDLFAPVLQESEDRDGHEQ